MHILHDKTNSFAPKDGSGYLIWLKYVTPDLKLSGLKAGAAFYVNGDTGLTDWNDNSKNAQGMFTDVNGASKALLGQAYVEYKNKLLEFKVGRQILHTPLTKIKWSLMPNFYQASVLKAKPLEKLTVQALFINKMAYGSRTATDYSLIGEKTGTAGVITAAIGQGAGTREQASFINLGKGAGLSSTSGMSALGINYALVNNLDISLWNYRAYNVANTVYTDAKYKISLSKDVNFILGGQYLKQKETGNALAGEIDFELYGVKASFGNQNWSIYGAYNRSNDDQTVGVRSSFFNAWGADPAYTSSIFSRNAYRQDVSAYKIGGEISLIKGLKLMVSHADYGQSKTLGWGTTPSNQDAKETDIVLMYKPTKALNLKIFNARRVSECSTSAVEREQNHIRAIASYNF